MRCPKNGKLKKGFAGRHSKIFWLSLIILVLLAGYVLFNWLFSTCCAPPPKTTPFKSIYTSEQRLADPKLLYAAMTSAGLCANEKHDQGGCYNNAYLYLDGRLVKDSGFIPYNGQREDNQPTQVQISNTVMSQISKKINDSNIMNKDCPDGQIMDAGWDYQLNFNGVKKTFHDVYGDCKKVFDDIDKLIKPAGG